VFVFCLFSVAKGGSLREHQGNGTAQLLSRLPGVFLDEESVEGGEVTLVGRATYKHTHTHTYKHNNKCTSIIHLSTLRLGHSLHVYTAYQLKENYEYHQIV